MKNAVALRIAGYAGLLLTLLYLIWFLKTVDISLIFYWQQSAPLTFGEALRNPGGVSVMLGEYFMMLLSRSVPGTAALIVLTGIVFFSLHLIFRERRSTPLFFPILLASLIPFIPLFAHYRLPLDLTLSVVSGLLLSALLSLWSPRNQAVAAVFRFAGGVAIYLAAGAAGWLILLQVLVIRAILSKGFRDLFVILPVLTIPALYLLFNPACSPGEAFTGSFLISKYNEIPRIFWFSLSSPLILLLLLLPLDLLLARLSGKRSAVLSGGLVLLVIAAVIFLSRNEIREEERSNYRILQAGIERDWDKVIRLTGGDIPINALIQFEINRALSQRGELLDRLFSYPQQFGEKGLFLEGNYSSRVSIHMSEFYLDMGFASEARHWATEAQMVFERNPVVLKNLVMSYLAYGNDKAALKYLNILSRSSLYREWCDRYRNLIENGSAREDPEIRFLVTHEPRNDFFATTTRPVDKIISYYGNDPDNKIAFEYLVGSFLLQHNVGLVFRHIPEFRRFGYEKLPRNVEEAILIYLTKIKEVPGSMSGYSLSNQTVQEFRDFSLLVAGRTSRFDGMERAARYRNTYWFYILFTSPYISTDQ